MFLIRIEWHSGSQLMFRIRIYSENQQQKWRLGLLVVLLFNQHSRLKDNATKRRFTEFCWFRCCKIHFKNLAVVDKQLEFDGSLDPDPYLDFRLDPDSYYQVCIWNTGQKVSKLEEIFIFRKQFGLFVCHFLFLLFKVQQQRSVAPTWVQESADRHAHLGVCEQRPLTQRPHGGTPSLPGDCSERPLATARRLQTISWVGHARHSG